jgi:sugar phosphate isomerase/epimerase
MNPIRRRELLQGALGALLPALTPLGCAADPPAASSSGPTAAPLASPLTTVGVQLYTLRDVLSADPEGTLSSIAALGYREVEFAGYFQLAPAAWKALLDRYGLSAPGAHFHLEVFQDTFQATLDNALTLGHRYLVMPFTPHEFRSPDGYRQMAAILNNAGQISAPQGVQVVFHNHDFDFQALPEALPGEPNLGYDILAAECDPALVSFELDSYWIEIAGHSTVEYLQRYAARTPLMHLKDTSPGLRMEDVGYGTLDWPSIIAAARTAGTQHFIVEHDTTTNPFASIQRSYSYLTSTG